MEKTEDKRVFIDTNVLAVMETHGLRQLKT